MPPEQATLLDELCAAMHTKLAPFFTAVGRGSRLADRSDCKPLTPVLGLPLIERSLLTASKSGLDDFCVVTGHKGEAVRGALDDLARRHSLNIRHVINDEWEKGMSQVKSDVGKSIIALRPR